MEQNWETLRLKMVDAQIRKRGVRDQRVLRAMRAVPRHEFVPSEERARAYDDCPLPIGLEQTISQPYIVGLMSELLRISAQHKVLEVGTGSGYQTAILSMLAREVFTIDIHPALLDAARQRIAAQNMRNVKFDVRNGHLGWPEFAPFDRIIVTAGAEVLPQPLIDQLVASGRMVIPVGPYDGEQILKVIIKTDESHIKIQEAGLVRFVPLV